MNRFWALAAAAVMALAAGAAEAAEFRLGVIAHDIDGPDSGVHGKEDSGGISLGIVTEPIRDGNFFLSPRIEVGADINLGGKTNFAYGGVLWRPYFGPNKQFYAEFSFGLGVHDGYNEIPDLDATLTPEEVEERIFLNAHYIEFGSDVLFREAFTLGWKVSENWATDVYWEHFSHGKILSNKSNEGVDTVGFRISRQLGGWQ